MLKPRRFLLLFCLMLFISLQTAALSREQVDSFFISSEKNGKSNFSEQDLGRNFSEQDARTPKALSLPLRNSINFSLQPTTEIAQNDPAAEVQRLFEEGLQLFQQGTAESLRQAMQKFEQALPLCRKAGNKEWEAVTLLSIGRINDDLGEKQKALDNYNQALPLFQAVGDKTGEAITLNNIGQVYDDLGEKQKALDYYSQSLPLSKAVGDKAQEATILNNIGRVYNSLGDKQKALDYYNQALPLSKAVGNKAGEAITLNNIGAVYNSLGDKQKALDYYSQALPLSKAVGDKAQEAITLNNIGQVYSDLGEKQKALDYYSQSLPLSKAVGDKTQEARTLNNIGAVYNDLGEKQKALDYYNQALPLAKAVENKAGEAITLNNIGAVYNDLGEKQKALDYYSQALLLSKAVGDKTQEARTFNNIGAVYNDLGEKQKALDYYSQSLPLWKTVEDKAGEAITLNNIGQVYSDLGDKQKALDYYNQALPLKIAVGDKAGEAVTLNNIGGVYHSLGEKQKALDYYSQALPLSKALGDKAGEAITLNNLGGVYHSLGDKQKALDYYNQALPLKIAVGDKAGEAVTLNNIGGVYYDLGEKQKALDYYSQALPLWKAVGDKAGEATTLSNVAFLEKNRGNLKEALNSIETAVDIIEDLRTKIVSPELRQTYFATVQDDYELYIDILMQLHQQDPNKGYNAIALNASERARARTLLELLTEANANIRTGVDPNLLAQEKTLQNKLDANEKQRIEIYSNKDATQDQKTAIEQERKTLLSQYQDIKDQIRVKSPNYASLKYPTPLTLEQIQQQVLDDDTILLQYSLGKEHSYLWLVTRNSMSSYQLPPRTEIETLAQDFYQLLNNPGYDPIRGGLVVVPGKAKLESPSQLSQIILAPVISQLKAKRLLIVADGALQYIPFAALPIPTPRLAGEGTGERSIIPLLTQYEIVNSPSSTTLGVIRQQEKETRTAQKTIAIFADPVFSADDKRVKVGANKSPIPPLTAPPLVRGVGGDLDAEDDLPQLQLTRGAREMDIGVWKRLDGTRTEANAILAMVNPSQQLSVFDFDANLTNAINIPLNQYKIVHFATHGMLNSESPELSGLVLSLVNQQGNNQNGFLRLHEIFNLSLPNTDLVVLSACQTGLGKSIQGEGLVGLTRGFMYAGSPRVIVSLWQVSDAATAELMKRFYRLILQENVPPAQALRTAQLEMMQQTQWKSPYYWAAFTLQGEWMGVREMLRNV